MDVNDPLPRLLRLRGAITEAIPGPGARIDQTNVGLIDLYERYRLQAISLCHEIGVARAETDVQLPPLVRTPRTHGPRQMLNDMTDANTAATMLADLKGFLSGLIEGVALGQQIDQQQLQAAQEAAKQPPGFR